jgi:hypothetical protein
MSAPVGGFSRRCRRESPLSSNSERWGEKVDKKMGILGGIPKKLFGRGTAD